MRTGTAAASFRLTGRSFCPSTVLPSGEPVIPVFEGWIPNRDGTITLSFGYFNLNTEEVLHIPSVRTTSSSPGNLMDSSLPFLRRRHRSAAGN